MEVDDMPEILTEVWIDENGEFVIDENGETIIVSQEVKPTPEQNWIEESKIGYDQWSTEREVNG